MSLQRREYSVSDGERAAAAAAVNSEGVDYEPDYTAGPIAGAPLDLEADCEFGDGDKLGQVFTKNETCVSSTRQSLGLLRSKHIILNQALSIAMQYALGFKSPLASAVGTGSCITEAMVSLENVDNTADAIKPL